MENENEFDIFFLLGILANVLQLENYRQNVHQTSNDEVVKHLIKATDIQTKILLDRLEIKLDKILENQARLEGN